MEDKPSQKIRGRGAAGNVANRFESVSQVSAAELNYLGLDGYEPEFDVSPRTIVIKDHSRSAIAKNSSPDIPFDFSVNPYRGCEHGCVYCYARPTHEYLGMSAGLDFETKIMVKENIADLLRDEFISKKWRPAVLSMSGVTDCYQPLERKFKLTRQCLQVCAEFKNPVTVITKNQLILRDLDILKELASWNGTAVFISVTSLDSSLAAKMEPRTSSPRSRLRAIECLSRAGIPVGVMVAPVIPGLTDHELPHILKAAAQAGAKFAGYVPVRLPYAVKDIFMDWLRQTYPEKESKVTARLHAIRDGKLNDSEFGSRMEGKGIFAEQIGKLFDLMCRKHQLNQIRLALSTEHFVRPLAHDSPKRQLSLFSAGVAEPIEFSGN